MLPRRRSSKMSYIKAYYPFTGLWYFLFRLFWNDEWLGFPLENCIFGMCFPFRLCVRGVTEFLWNAHAEKAREMHTDKKKENLIKAEKKRE